FRLRRRRLHLPLGSVHRSHLLPHGAARRLSPHDAQALGAHVAPVPVPRAAPRLRLPCRRSHRETRRPPPRPPQPSRFLFQRRRASLGFRSVPAHLPPAAARHSPDVHHLSRLHLRRAPARAPHSVENHRLHRFRRLGLRSIWFPRTRTRL